MRVPSSNPRSLATIYSSSSKTEGINGDAARAPPGMASRRRRNDSPFCSPKQTVCLDRHTSPPVSRPSRWPGNAAESTTNRDHVALPFTGGSSTRQRKDSLSATHGSGKEADTLRPKVSFSCETSKGTVVFFYRDRGRRDISISTRRHCQACAYWRCAESLRPESA